MTIVNRNAATDRAYAEAREDFGPRLDDIARCRVVWLHFMAMPNPNDATDASRRYAHHFNGTRVALPCGPEVTEPDVRDIIYALLRDGFRYQRYEII